MANYSNPWATNGPRRDPTAEEQDLGYPCGAFELSLLNGLMFQLQSELKAVIDEGGVAHTNLSNTLVRDAILNMIAAATGGSGDFVLMDQARARLPIHFEVESADGRINVTTPSAGTVRVPSGATMLHRGIYEITTAEEDFATAASKTYHLRWNPTDGFVLEDLADSLYNPSTLTEENVAFDSAYDDALISRVVTNSSNAATITNLSNKAKLWLQTAMVGTSVYLSGKNFSSALMQATINWARTPQNRSFSIATAAAVAPVDDIDQAIWDPSYSLSEYQTVIAINNANPFGDYNQFPVTRYESRFRWMYDATSKMVLDAAFHA